MHALRYAAAVLVDFQNAFIALVADEQVRGRFLTDPDGALEEMSCELSSRERTALKNIPADELVAYAHSLIEKRWSEVQRVVPMTTRVAPSLRARYRQWALRNPARAMECQLSPGAAEALRACEVMRAALADPREATYAAQLWQFEVLRAASRGDGTMRELSTDYSVHELVSDIARGLLPIDPTPCATQYEFSRDRLGVKRK